MIDGMLAYFLVSLIPIALLFGGRAEHVLFVGWRWLQVVTLFAVAAHVLYRTVRSGWRDVVLLVAIAVGIGYIALSYSAIAWDAQIEYHRVVLLAARYGGLTEGYRHGVANWILGYPPGTSLSVMFYSTLHLASANVAQGLLTLLWSAVFMQRHMRNVDFAGKAIFFVLLGMGEHALWHVTYFYNNLFYALIWAELVLAPMLGSSMRPWERVGWALVLVWLRPQWQIAAIPIGSSALSTLLAAKSLDLRFVRDLALTTMAALLVAWLGSGYWRTASAALDRAISEEKMRVVDAIGAEQDRQILAVETATKALEQQRAPTPPLLSRASLDAVDWAFYVTKHVYRRSMWMMGFLALFALVTLRRRGLMLLVPLLSPLALVLGTAVFARMFPGYRSNEWALERLQIITPILAAGMVTALHRAIRLQQT